MKKVLEISHPEIDDIKKQIRDEEELNEENYPEYTAIAHDHFSSRVHQYIHNKKKMNHDLSNMSGVFPGRYKAIKAVKILFNSICSPRKGRHKR